MIPARGWVSVSRLVGGVEETRRVPVRLYACLQPASPAMRDDPALLQSLRLIARGELGRALRREGGVSLVGRVEGAEVSESWEAMRWQADPLPEAWWRRLLRLFTRRARPTVEHMVPCSLDDPRATMLALRLEAPAVLAAELGEGHPWLA